MKDIPSELIDLNELRMGMFVELDMGWLSHPFASSSFKISSDQQIATLRSLGAKQIRFYPSKSDFAVPDSGLVDLSDTQTPVDQSREKHAKQLEAQRRSLVICERQFGEAARQYKQIMDQAQAHPEQARDQCVNLVGTYVDDMGNLGETVIRLLSQGASERTCVHAVNVTVLSLLLGRAMGLSQTEMLDLGVGAFMHDVGKQLLPERVRTYNASFSTPEMRLYQDHVAQGVTLGQSMGLSKGVLQIIANHHEMVDGSGFPSHAVGAALTRPAKILALINRYENMCNPSRPSTSVTPHEALAMIFAQLKTRFDGAVMSAFIRMMGVYPPGSIVQLMDDRFAMVMSVNSSRPLKPRVLIHDLKIPKHDALITDLEMATDLSIRRSVKPADLPPQAVDYLMPRQRVCYFFEREALPDASSAG